MSITLEICVDSVESALAAYTGGANRIELCCALREGGLTPSAGLIHTIRNHISIDMYVLIRPRSGDFCFSQSELDVMCDDVRRARNLGADGVVVGMLTRDGHVDIARTARLVIEARPMKVTFNRAFDLTADLDRALEDVVQTGCNRILTSGGQRTGMKGAAKIAELVRRAGSRIAILGGGGIRHSNVCQFVAATGVSEIHTSLRTRTEVPVQTQKSDVILGTQDDTTAQYIVTDEEVVKLRKAVDSHVLPAR